MGGLNNGPPWSLFTVDAASGAVLYSPTCPSGAGGQVLGLEYDNTADVLYCILANGTADYFCSLDPTTGSPQIIQDISASFSGYTCSAFDQKDHEYIFTNGSQLSVVNVTSGNVVYNQAFAAGTSVSNLVYDSANGLLYGVCNLSGTQNAQFVSITPSTAAESFIAALPPVSIPQINAYTVNEQAGTYIFVAAPQNANCILNNLYVVDVNSGAILSQQPYPYAQNTALSSDANIINFCFDNVHNILYALNWQPPNTLATNTISIQASANTVCIGDTVIFTATYSGNIANPTYQWLVNGAATGTNSPVFTGSGFNNNDTVYCIVSGSTPCAISMADTSNKIGIQVSTGGMAAIGITASALNICTGDTVVFTTTVVNGGGEPRYQWQVNGANAGTDTTAFTDDSLKNGDIISCVLTSSLSCALNKTTVSNSIIMQVGTTTVTASITALPDTVCAGSPVQFAALATNADANAFYQWQVNGSNMGADLDTFTSASLNNGDIIDCRITSGGGCAYTSPPITVTVNPLPTVALPADTVVAPGKSVLLVPVITGNISGYQWSPPTGLSSTTLAQVVASPAAAATYQLQVVTTQGCTNIGKIIVYIGVPLQMPGAFTPNGDGANDVFRIPPSTPQTIT